MFIPHAIEVDGQIMTVFDPVYHHPVAARTAEHRRQRGVASWLKQTRNYDRRYVRVARPWCITGGELTLDQLDLQYDPYTRCTRRRSR